MSAAHQFKQTGQCYEPLRPEDSLDALYVVADESPNEAARIEALSRAARAGFYVPPGWRASVLKNTGRVAQSDRALAEEPQRAPAASNPEVAGSSPAPTPTPTGNATSAAPTGPTDAVAAAGSAAAGSALHTETAKASETLAGASAGVDVGLGQRVALEGSTPSSPVPCGAEGSSRRRHRFDGEPFCKHCGATNRVDRIVPQDEQLPSEAATPQAPPPPVAAAPDTVAAGGVPLITQQPHEAVICSCGHPDGWHRYGNAACLECACLAFKHPPRGEEAILEVLRQGAGGIMRAEEYTRDKYLGSGDIAALCGCSARGSPLSVYLAKVLPEEPSDAPEAEWLEWGRELQPLIAAKTCKKIKACLLNNSDEEVEVFDPARPWLRAHIDSVATGDDDRMVVIECKATGPFATEWANLDVEECAPSSFVQVTYQTALFCKTYPKMGTPRMVVARLINGQTLKVYELEYDADLGGLLLDKAADFWREHVLPKIPPPLDVDSGGEYLRRRWPKANGRMRPPTEDEKITAEALRLANLAHANAVSEVKRLRLMLAASIGELDGLEGVATYRPSGTAKAWKKIAEEVLGELSRRESKAPGIDAGATERTNREWFDLVVKRFTTQKNRALRLIGEKEDDKGDE